MCILVFSECGSWSCKTVQLFFQKKNSELDLGHLPSSSKPIIHHQLCTENNKTGGGVEDAVSSTQVLGALQS